MNVNRGTIHPFLFSRRRKANQQGLHARKRYALNFCCVARGHHQHTNASLMQVGWDELLSLRRSPDGRTKWAFDESQPRVAHANREALRHRRMNLRRSLKTT